MRLTCCGLRLRLHSVQLPFQPLQVTDHEFEDAYREALVCLADVGHVVAGPIGTDGSRVCIVDGQALNDYAVLNLWWGKKIADQIRHERKP
jgi:hypothetical protein